jgi:L-ascorbate metabolism protein UlaG (beta-lactamase superfamily)
MGLAGFMSFQTIPAYNVDKPFHPKTKDWVGYVLEFDNLKFYFTGDTDLIPEFKETPLVDYCILPVSGTYVMTAIQASEAAKIIRAKHFIPCHYGFVVGSSEDAKEFAKLVPNAIVMKELECLQLSQDDDADDVDDDD